MRKPEMSGSSGSNAYGDPQTLSKFLGPCTEPFERGMAPDVESWEGWPARPPSLLFAGLALEEPKYVDLWKRLSPDPEDAEIRRNIAITQPLLWLEWQPMKSQ